MPQKPSIRVRVSDGKPREWKKLKAALGGYGEEGKVYELP